MRIHHVDGDKERQDRIKAVLPEQTIISSVLEPLIEHSLFSILAQCVRQELEVYRKYPKKTKKYSDKEEETNEQRVKTFDPRNNETCFMGKGFRGNTHSSNEDPDTIALDTMTDAELDDYRAAIGTIHHPMWGDCTLMEIWGGDHFEEHNEMVVGAFKYGMNMTDECPEIKFYANPLFHNKKSKRFKLSKAQRLHKLQMDELLAKALVFGVRTPQEAKKARAKRIDIYGLEDTKKQWEKIKDEDATEGEIDNNLKHLQDEN